MIKCISFVSRCSHLSCRSRRFDCLLLVFIRRWGRVIGAFRSSLSHYEVVSREVRFEFVPSAVRCCTGLRLCYLIVGIHASGISYPLSHWAYQCESRSINFSSFQSGWWPVLLACSDVETAEVWVRASRLSLSCSFTSPAWIFLFRQLM